MLQKDILIAIYCIIDDLLKASGHKFDKRAKLSDSEVLFLGVVAALNFGGVWQHALSFLSEYGFLSLVIDKSRLSRRMQQLEEILDELIDGLACVWIALAAEKEFILDGTDIVVCDNIRISRTRMIEGEEFRGYKASFRRYFYGLKLQLLITKDGMPVSYTITEGSMHDNQAKELLDFSLLGAEAEVGADAAYTDYDFEDKMREKNLISWLSQRKANSKRQRSREEERMIAKMRKKIETVYSQIKGLFKRKIHAVTIEGLMRKVKFFIFAYQLKFIL